MERALKTTVTADYIEITLTGNPTNPRDAYKNPNSVLENLYTGTVVDAPKDTTTLGYVRDEIIGKGIVFAKLFKIVVDENETKYYVHRNAVVASID